MTVSKRKLGRSRQQAAAAIFRTFPTVLVIGLDLDADPPRYEFQAPGFDPSRRLELADLMEDLAAGMREDEAKAGERPLSEGHEQKLVTEARYAPGTKVKVMVWSQRSELRGRVGEVVCVSDGQRNPASVTYDVLFDDGVKQLSEDEIMEER